jgi:hypothetical protein
MVTFSWLSCAALSARSARRCAALGVSIFLLSAPNLFAVEPTVITNPKPLVISEGNAKDLNGTLSRDASLWLGGVGGDDGSEIEGSVYEIHQDPYQINVQDLNRSLEVEASQTDEFQAVIFRLPLN